MTTPVVRPEYEHMALAAKQAFLTVTDEKTWNREIVFALQIIRGSEKLQKCDPMSIKNSVVNIALTGATLNPALAQAYLIPRKGKCCLDFSYRGLCKIAVDSDSVYDIDAAAVFEGDVFDYELGLSPRLVHKPQMSDQPRKVVAAYAIAILHHDIRKFVVLDQEKIARARKSSQYDTVWNEHPDEMAKKTAVKLLYKMLPQTDRMSTAISVVNEHEGIEKPESNATKLIERFAEKQPEPVYAPLPCPDRPDETMTKEFCDSCKDREGCPVWT